MEDTQQESAFSILLQLDQPGGAPVYAGILLKPQAAQVMADGTDPGLDPLRDPDPVHEVANLSIHAYCIPRIDREPLSILRIHPYRVLVADLVQPLRVRAAGVDQRWQPEVRQQDHFAF